MRERTRRCQSLSARTRAGTPCRRASTSARASEKMSRVFLERRNIPPRPSSTAYRGRLIIRHPFPFRPAVAERAGRLLSLERMRRIATITRKSFHVLLTTSRNMLFTLISMDLCLPSTMQTMECLGCWSSRRQVGIDIPLFLIVCIQCRLSRCHSTTPSSFLVDEDGS